MTLLTGSRIGHYEVTDRVGAGGMGEVYRARDSRLGRDVALKILPPEFAADPERLARFKREAQLLASLSHPNIAAIHGIEELDGAPLLVLEYVPGENLAGPVPLEDALNSCRQIADALETAHEKGIVHRDLKPANIRITPEGKVKVLDFGLAKAVAGDVAAAASATSPTLTIAATQAGVLLGTAAYMSPEQVRGKNADKRADIWAFGCILYELLTGRKAFDGDNFSDVLAAVLKTEPDWTALPVSTPSGIRRLLHRCLEKDPKRRLRDIGDAWPEMEDAPAESQPSATRLPSAWILATAVSVFVAIALCAILFFQKPPAAPTTRFQVLPPDRATFTEYPTISPDGRRLAFVATVDGKTLLWVHSFDSLAARPLAGTENASFPFWSADSRFLAFFAGAKLRKVAIDGGLPQALCDITTPGRGGSWNGDGTILFVAGNRSAIRRISAGGGVSAPVTTLDSSDLAHRWPHFLPDGRHFVYWLQAINRGRSAVVIGSLDDKPESKERRRLLSGASMAASSSGFLFFERDGALMAQPFDTKQLQLRGEPSQVVPEIGQITGTSGYLAFSVSSNGAIAYRTDVGAKTQLVWFDRAGKELAQVGRPERQEAPELSPDQKRIAIARREGSGTSDIWLLEWARDVPIRFTFHPLTDWSSVWSPDGSRVVFASNRDGYFNLFQKAANSSAHEELLLQSDQNKYPTDWSSDGRYLLYQAFQQNTGGGLWVLPSDGGRKAALVLDTEFSEQLGQFSPDARWIAYQSDESMPRQVYVLDFPRAKQKIRVSATGGVRPRWRRDGKEIYYITPDRKMMAVEVTVGETTFEVGRSRELFQTREAASPSYYFTYDVTGDGQRFLINSALESETPPPMTVVMNWASTQR